MASWAGLTPPVPDSPGGSDTPPRECLRLPTSTLAKMAPKTATPKDPPMERKKVTPEVAVPRSS